VERDREDREPGPVVERFGTTLVVNPGPYGFNLRLP
jgi:hypothetical protein